MALTSAEIRRVAGRTFGEPLHFLGNHRESAAGFTCRCGLDGSIEGQHVRLLGDVGNQLGDFTNLL